MPTVPRSGEPSPTSPFVLWLASLHFFEPPLNITPFKSLPIPQRGNKIGFGEREALSLSQLSAHIE